VEKRETMEVSMYLHGLMVMAKNVEDHRLVMLRARGPGLFFRERKFSFEKKGKIFGKLFLWLALKGNLKRS